ncbi:MAG: FeoA family protein [Cyanobacteriota bacterium]|nr:FeoA family protein [Cyanobacteriota bacterium]
MTLAQLEPQQLAIVEKVAANASQKDLARRLEAMGIAPNKRVKVLRKAWFGGPLHIRIGSTTEVAIRKQEAEMVLVKMVNESS